jgi:hypothetical protein
MWSTEDEYQRRMNICRSCEKFRARLSQCKVCKCFMPFKARFEDADCPARKWDAKKQSDREDEGVGNNGKD